MADRLVPGAYASLSAAYSAAVSGADTVSLLGGSTVYPAEVVVLSKNVTIRSQGIEKAILDCITGSRALAFKSGCSGTALQNLIINSGSTGAISLDSTGTATISQTDCDLVDDGQIISGNAVLGLTGPGVTYSIQGGSILSTDGAICINAYGGVSLSVDDCDITCGAVSSGITHGYNNGASSIFSVKNCTIVSAATSATILSEQTASSAGNVKDVDIVGNIITSTYKDGHIIQVGNEATTAGDGVSNGYVISNNVLTGTKGASGNDDGINHGILAGFVVNGEITKNLSIGVQFAIVWKGTGIDNTSGNISLNVSINASTGIRIKGVDAAKVVNNTTVISGANSTYGFLLSDNDGAGTGNDCYHVGNVYHALGKTAAGTGSVNCSFAAGGNHHNCYIVSSLTAFALLGVTGKSWAEWVAATGEENSFCIVQNEADWDVYTSDAPTVVNRTLSECPINSFTGKINDCTLNPLIHGCPVENGINPVADLFGNPALAMPNIGADQYDYAIGFGPWVDFDPTSFVPPVGLATSAIGEVKRVFTYTEELSTSKIEKLATTPEKFGFLGNEDWNNLADKDW